MQACKQSKRYRALYAPKCDGGRVCETCAAKWQAKQRAMAKLKTRVAK